MVVFCPTQAVCQCHRASDLEAEAGLDVEVGSWRRDADHRRWIRVCGSGGILTLLRRRDAAAQLRRADGWDASPD